MEFSRNMIRYHQALENEPLCTTISPSAIPIQNIHQEVEILYAVHGSTAMDVSGHLLNIECGELLCVGANIIHQYRPPIPFPNTAKLKFRTEWILPPFISPEAKEALLHLYADCFITRADPKISLLFTDMLSHPPEGYRSLYLLAKIMELSDHLLTHPDSIRYSVPNLKKASLYLKETLRYIEDNYQAPLSLKSLAGHLGLSESYCSKYIRKIVGISFVDYLNATRINHAQRLLAFSDASITEIAQQTGFSCSQSFNRVFKEKTGCSHSQFRKGFWALQQSGGADESAN